MTTYCLNPNSTWLAVYNLNTGTMPTNNVVFSTISANLSATATSITVKTGEGALFTQGMIATLEQLQADGKTATAREVVLISGINGDTITLTRGYENCVMDDTASPKVLGNTPLAFTSGARISVYVSRALLNGVQTRLSQVNCPCNTSIYNQAIALSSCITNCYDELRNGVVEKYYECCGDYGYGLGCDGDCVVEGIEYWDADKIYQFCNLTICEGGCVRFIKYGVPQIYVKEKFINNGVLDLRGGMFVGNCSLTRCGKTINNKGCLACYQALCNGCGGEGGYGPNGRGCTGCNNASAICGGKGGDGGPSGGGTGANADGANGGQGGYGGSGWCSCCGSGGGGGGGGGDFGNGGRGGTGGYGYWGRTNYGRGLGGSGGNAGIFGRGGDGGSAGAGCPYSGTGGGSWVGGKGGNGWCGGHGGVGDNGWGGNAGSYGYQGGKGGDGGDGIVCGGNGGGGNGNCGGNGGKAITNVYALFLSARIICNHGSICGKGGNGGNGGYGRGYESCGCQRNGGNGGCGGNGGDILTVSENYAVVGDINVAGGTGGIGGTSNYGSAGSNGANGTAGHHYCLVHILH